MNGYIKNITGKKFGKLTVVLYSHTNEKSRNAYWNCICDCGKTKCVNGSTLRKGQVSSCGCLWAEEFPKKGTHNLTNSPEYYIWQGMKNRCKDPNHASYKHYGGRGITFSENWLKFENFIENMGFRPSDSHSLDRINNDLGYSKENCKWATKEEQSNNRRNVQLIEYLGEKMSITQWCRKLNIPLRRTRNRLEKKWPLDKVFHIENFNPYSSVLKEEEHIKEHRDKEVPF